MKWRSFGFIFEQIYFMKIILVCSFALIAIVSCKKKETFVEPELIENPSSFREVSSITIGGLGAAEISAYDEQTKKLFVVNNSGTNRIDVLDLANPAQPVNIGNIALASYNGAANSVAVSNGKLAVAIESTPIKQDAGKVLVFNTTTLVLLASVTVGSLPDMVTFTPDGTLIITADEGEPNDSYTNDPNGTISIIQVNNNYALTTLDFASFASQLTAMRSGGFRVINANGNIAQDVEPEYITVSDDSKTAWVTLQENNGISKVDLTTKTITNIFPLGFKDYNNNSNSIDVSDQDGGINFAAWNVKGMYMPDAITSYAKNGVPYIITANEGDAREYTALNEVKRVGNSAVILDPTVFPNAAALKANTQLGRLNISTKNGDIDNDGDLDVLHSFGARSFAIWNGNTGQLVFDSKNGLDQEIKNLNLYDDARSDDKSVEPEAVIVAKMGAKDVLFVGLERADAFAIYDVTDPVAPLFLKAVKTGDAPEGMLFVPASKSPNKKSMLIVSSENDGTIKIYQPDLL